MDQTDALDQDSKASAGNMAFESGQAGNARELEGQSALQLRQQKAGEYGELYLLLNHNAALPIHSVPAEVFIWVIDHHMSPYIKNYGKNYYRRLFSLSRVSSHWFKAIRDSPPLWARIHGLDSLEVVQVALQRSSGHLLDIVFHYDGQWSTSQSRLTATMDRLSMHRERWRSVDISVPFSWMSCVIPDLRKPAQNLERLSLNDEVTRYSAQEIDYFGGVASRLNELTLDGVSMRWDSELIQNLTILDLSWIRFPSMDTIFRILSHSPHLQKATIRRCKAKRTASPTSLTPIQLPRLSWLRIDFGSPDAIDYFLDHIACSERCSFGASLQTGENMEDFMQQRVLSWMSNWRLSKLVPFEGLLLDINGSDLQVELTSQDHSEPLSISLESLGATWTDQLQVALPHLIDAIAPWTGSGTTVRLKLGYLPSSDRNFHFGPFIVKELSRLPPITSMEVLCVGDGTAIRSLLHEKAGVLFRSISTLSFLRIDVQESDELCDTIRAFKDVVADPLDNTNSGELRKLELCIPFDVDSEKVNNVEVIVKRVEELVGFGKVFVVDDN